MSRTERYFYDYETLDVVSEGTLQEVYDSLMEVKEVDYDNFEQYIDDCTHKNGSLTQLHRGLGQFDTVNERKPEAAARFAELIHAHILNETDYDIQIVVNGFVLQARDHGALLQGLQSIVQRYADELDER